MSVELQMDLSALDALIKDMPSMADRFVRTVALDVEAAAKKKAPVDTGFLRGTIRMEDPVRGDAQADVVVGGRVWDLRPRGSTGT